MFPYWDTEYVRAQIALVQAEQLARDTRALTHSADGKRWRYVVPPGCRCTDSFTCGTCLSRPRPVVFTS